MYPNAFLSEMKRLLGEEYPRFLASASEPPCRALHVNLAKTTPAALAGALGYALSPVPYAPDGFYLESEEKAGRHPLHHAGGFYMQEPSAMAPVCCLHLTENMRVLDVCAAPGGKSTQIANRIGSGGLLVSNEFVPARCTTLTGNLERMGLKNAVVTDTDAAVLAARYPGFFDAVVVDAPCSGEGMFRKDPAAVEQWSEGSVRACAVRQADILRHAAECVRPGGELVYSTCTFSPEENERVLYDFLMSHPEFSLLPVSAPLADVTAPALCPAEDETGRGISAHARRFYPHIAKGEGQFFALLSKSAAAPAPPLPKKVRDDVRPLTREEQRVWDAFVRENLTGRLPAPVIFKGAVSLLDGAVPTADDVTYARGVRAGQVEKGRLIPAHWLFSAYGGQFARRLPLSLSDPRLTAYLRGETFPCSLPDGWACVTVEGCPLGGIKVTGGIAKNHYPKGLRLRA